MVTDARRMARAARHRRRRTLITSTTLAMVVSGGAAAAVAASDWSAPWAAQPLTNIAFTLPSGSVCEQRIGDFRLPDKQAQDDITNWLGAHRWTELGDIGATLRQIRSASNEWTTTDGHTFSIGYGTAHYDADYEYYSAVWRLIMTAIEDKLHTDGYGDNRMRWASETHCTGPNQDPEEPWWAK